MNISNIYFVILDEAELQELPFRFVHFSNSTPKTQLNLMSNRFENEILLQIRVIEKRFYFIKNIFIN